MFSLSRENLRMLEQNPTFVNRLILKLRSDSQSLLSTVLFGNELTNVFYYSVATVAAIRATQAGNHALAAGIGIGSLVALVMFGEITPKNMAVVMPMRFAKIVAIPLYTFQKIIWPVRKVLSGILAFFTKFTRGKEAQPYVTPEELQHLIKATGSRGHIAQVEGDMMREVMEFAQIRVPEVMVPRVNVVAYEVNGPVDVLREKLRPLGISKIPIYEGTIDNVIGIVYAHDVFLSNLSIRESIKPVPLFVPESARIEQVLQQFREKRCQFACVVDEYGGWAGIITLEDIIEEVVGDISDEYDPTHESVKQLGPDKYILSGSVSIREWSQIFGIGIDLAEAETLSGYIMLTLGRIPVEGDRVEVGNLRLTVQRVVRRYASEVLVERLNGTKK